MKQLLLINLLCLLCFLSYSATNIYYLSYSGGNDANTAAQAQNQNTPWKTMDKILTGMTSGTIPAGSIILLKRGDAWLMPRDFNINRGLTFDQYGPGNIKPYITGLLSVTNGRWTLKDANLGIWETTDTIVNPRSNTLNMVTINGIPYAMGRTPNANATNKGWLNYESHTSTSVTDSQSPFDASYNGSQIVLRTTHTNIERGAGVTVSGTTINFSTSGFQTGINSANGWGYFLQNGLKHLDQFGEWYYNTGTKKLSVCMGQLNNPNNFVVQYPYLDTMIQPRSSNVTFKNIQITGANRFIVWNDWTGLTNIWFRNCDFAYSGGDCIDYHGKVYCGVDSCTAMYANSNGFSFGSSCNGSYVLHSTITHIAKFPGMLYRNSSNRYGHGVFCSGQQNQTDTGLTCMYSRITDIGYTGVFFGENNNNVSYNYIDSVCSVQDDGGCIYIYNYPTGGVVKVNTYNFMTNNILLHCFGAPEGTPGNATSGANNWGYALYFDDNTNHATALNNVIAYAGGAGMMIHNTNRSRVENNLFYDNANEQIFMNDDNIGDSIYKDTVRYNTFMPIKSSALVYRWMLGNDVNKDSKNFDTWGIINNNYIDLPFTTNVTNINHTGGLFAYYDLAAWRSTWNYDLLSTTLPRPIINANQINFVYNTSFVNDNSFSFPCDTYISTANVSYFNSIMLKPLEGKILLYNNQ